MEENDEITFVSRAPCISGKVYLIIGKRFIRSLSLSLPLVHLPPSVRLAYLSLTLLSQLGRRVEHELGVGIYFPCALQGLS